MRKKLLFLVNIPEFFISHRLPIALAAIKQGYEVHVACSVGVGIEELRSHGIHFHKINFSRSGQNLVHELKVFYSVFNVLRSVEPHVLHLVTIKPMIYGGFFARLLGLKSVFAVTGLGTVFLDGSLWGSIRRKFVLFCYRFVLNNPNAKVIFQNGDDQTLICKKCAVNPAKTVLIAGAGVDLIKYKYMEEPTGNVCVVVMAARLLKDKGVHEFVDAARQLKNHPNIQFKLVGDLDPDNVSSILPSDIELWNQEAFIEITGFQRDIAKLYSEANIVCLPSYREGLPKSLIEAAACGRAVVTTDTAGCRDVIIPDETGLLVPVKNSVLLADAILKLAQNPSLRKLFGANARKLAEEKFALQKILDQHFEIYQFPD